MPSPRVRHRGQVSCTQKNSSFTRKPVFVSNRKLKSTTAHWLVLSPTANKSATKLTDQNTHTSNKPWDWTARWLTTTKISRPTQNEMSKASEKAKAPLPAKREGAGPNPHCAPVARMTTRGTERRPGAYERVLRLDLGGGVLVADRAVVFILEKREVRGTGGDVDSADEWSVTPRGYGLKYRTTPCLSDYFPQPYDFKFEIPILGNIKNTNTSMFDISKIKISGIKRTLSPS
jgi:hypothetical protein